MFRYLCIRLVVVVTDGANDPTKSAFCTATRATTTSSSRRRSKLLRRVNLVMIVVSVILLFTFYKIHGKDEWTNWWTVAAVCRGGGMNDLRSWDPSGDDEMRSVPLPGDREVGCDWGRLACIQHHSCSLLR